MSELVVGSLAGLASNSYVVDVASGSTLDLTNSTDLPSSALPVGSVLQVASVTKVNSFSTTSGSFVDLPGLTLTVTPSSSSSKFLLLCDIVWANSGATNSQWNFVRNGTNVGQPNFGTVPGTMTLGNSGNPGGTGANSFLDSPGTGSAVTYKIQVRTGGSTLYINRAYSSANVSAISTLTVMEIAG